MRNFIICTHPQISDQVKEDEMGRECGTHGTGEKMYKVLVWKTKRERPLRRPRCRWEDGIRMDLEKTGWRGTEFK
jgi:hypothetical protein